MRARCHANPAPPPFRERAKQEASGQGQFAEVMMLAPEHVPHSRAMHVPFQKETRHHLNRNRASFILGALAPVPMFESEDLAHRSRVVWRRRIREVVNV
jgi:hypothetical protein